MADEPLLEKISDRVGPGFVTGAADNDPSGISTYSQTGAMFAYTQLWTVVLTLPFMIAIQEICGRIGLVTGKGLAGVIKKFYSKRILYAAVVLLLIANIINIGADLGAMAAAMQLVVPASFGLLLAAIVLFSLLLQILVSYPTYAAFLKYLSLALLAYVFTAFVVHEPWLHIAQSTLMPHIVWSKEYLVNLMALLGTTISPYLFFWQADEEVEEIRENGEPRSLRKAVHKVRSDTTLGMVFSQIVTFFIIITVASTLGVHGIREVATAQDAASALRPLAGNFAFLLFTIGMVGAGLVTVPILAGSASYAVAESVGWKSGLSKKFHQARGFYTVIIGAMFLGLLINFIPISPILMLYYASVVNGVLAPPLMAVILIIGNNEKILGRYTNSRLSNTFGWIITVIMGMVATVLIAGFFGVNFF